MAENTTPQQETQKRIQELKKEFDLENLDLVKETERINSSFRSESSASKEAIRERLLRSFKEDGFLKMTRDDIILFMEQYRRGQFVFEHSEQDRRNIAEMIAALPETKDPSLISHWKIRPIVAFNRFRRNTAINFAAKKLQKIQAKSDLQKAAIYYKYHGNDSDVALKKAQDPDYVPADEAYKAALSNVGFFRRQWTKLRYGNPSSEKLREFKVGKNASATYGGLDKDYYDNTSRFKGWFMELREKYWMKDAPISLLQERQQTIKTKIAELHEQIAAGESKSASKKSNRQLRRLTRLLAAADNAEKKRNFEMNKKMTAVDEKYAPMAKTQQKNIARRFEIIQEKTDILDQSTTRGKYLYALLQKAPATQRKALEAIVLERKRQEFSSEKDFIDYVKTQFEAGNFNKKDALIQTIAQAVAREEGRGWGPQREESKENPGEPNTGNAEENENTDRVHEGHGNQPPAPDPNWQQQSEQELRASYENSAYELISPQREGPHADDENVLYQTFKSKEDDHTVTVEKPTANDYNLSAKDKDGKDTVPSVDDMKAVMESIKKSGHKSMELGEIKSPEFLARAEIAAADAGITITNLEDKRKELVEKDRENVKKIDREKEKIVATDLAKDLNINLDTKYGIDKAVTKLESLKNLQALSPEQFAAYKKSEQYTKMSDKEKKLFDDTYKLTHDETFRKSPESTRARNLNRLIGKYQAATNLYAREQKKKRGKAQNPNTRAVKEAARAMGYRAGQAGRGGR